MGIDAHALHLLSYAREFGELGDTVMIGRQSIQVGARRLERRYGFANPHNDKFCEGLLREKFGARIVDSIDYSSYEGASIVHDMNLPLSAGTRKYHTILDFGTVEHVFDAPQALRNMVSLCEQGGQILHVSPANNFCGHGLWQVSPELFFALYCERNGFRDTEVFVANRRIEDTWYRVKKLSDGERAHIRSPAKTSAVCRTVLFEEHHRPLQVQQTDYVHVWNMSETERAPEQSTFRLLDWVNTKLYKLRYKLFRGLSDLNPSLTRVDLR